MVLSYEIEDHIHEEESPVADLEHLVLSNSFFVLQVHETRVVCELEGR